MKIVSLQLGWFANPIFSEKGNYPAVMMEQIAKLSGSEGRTRSRLPVLSDYWIGAIRGSADFLGLNYYTSRYVELVNEPYNKDHPSHHADTRLRFSTKPEWKKGKSAWLYSVPTGIRDILK